MRTDKVVKNREGDEMAGKHRFRAEKSLPKKRILYIYLHGKVFLTIGLDRNNIARHSGLRLIGDVVTEDALFFSQPVI
jgi:hypothetical protein